MNSYSRKISTEESNEQYIFVYKDRLNFFPSRGKTFLLDEGPRHKRARVESYPCLCHGPHEPHRHYYIRWKGLQKGDTIVIRRDPNHRDEYKLRIEHPASN